MSLLAKFATDGVRLEALPGGKLRALGNLTDATRALIRAHKPAILAELAAANDSFGPDSERRCIKALAMLEADPSRQIAVIAEAGDPAIVGVAIRGVAYGELEIPADRYDAFALLALMDQYAAQSSNIVH